MRFHPLLWSAAMVFLVPTLTALEKMGKLSRPPAAAGGRRAEG